MIPKDFGLESGMHGQQKPSTSPFVNYLFGLMEEAGMIFLRSYSPEKTFDPKVVIIGESRRQGSPSYPSRQDEAIVVNSLKLEFLIREAATPEDVLLSDGFEGVPQRVEDVPRGNPYRSAFGRVRRIEFDDSLPLLQHQADFFVRKDTQGVMASIDKRYREAISPKILQASSGSGRVWQRVDMAELLKTDSLIDALEKARIPYAVIALADPGLFHMHFPPGILRDRITKENESLLENFARRKVL